MADTAGQDPRRGPAPDASRSGPAPPALARRFCAALCLLLAAPLLLVAASGSPPPVSLVWDAANALGFLALAGIFLLFIYAGRPGGFPPFSGRFFANLHRDLGYLALLFTLAHVVPLLVLEPLLLEHLKVTAPGYMLAGLAAALMTILLVITSITRLRRRLWRDYRLFRAVHGWIAVIIAALLSYHVLGSGYYLNHPVELGLVGLAGLGILVYYLARRLRLTAHSGAADRRRTRAPHSPVQQERHRDSARYSHLVSYGGAAALVVICLAWVLAHNLV